MLAERSASPVSGFSLASRLTLLTTQHAPDDGFWYKVDEELYFHRLNVIAGLEVKYKYEDPEIKLLHCHTRPGHSHISTPSPEALASFLTQRELAAESLNEHAQATVLGQEVATLDGRTIHFRMSKFRSSLSISRDLDFLPYLTCGTSTWPTGSTTSWIVEAVVI